MLLQRKCKFSGELFSPKRNNQLYLNRQNQIAFNNHKALIKRKAKSEIDKLLDNNRTILMNVLNGEKSIIKHKEYLLGAGFHFGVFSYQKKVGEVLFSGIYEYGIGKKDETHYQLIRF